MRALSFCLALSLTGFVLTVTAQLDERGGTTIYPGAPPPDDAQLEERVKKTKHSLPWAETITRERSGVQGFGRETTIVTHTPKHKNTPAADYMPDVILNPTPAAELEERDMKPTHSLPWTETSTQHVPGLHGLPGYKHTWTITHHAEQTHVAEYLAEDTPLAAPSKTHSSKSGHMSINPSPPPFYVPPVIMRDDEAPVDADAAETAVRKTITIHNPFTKIKTHHEQRQVVRDDETLVDVDEAEAVARTMITNYPTVPSFRPKTVTHHEQREVVDDTSAHYAHGISGGIVVGASMTEYDSYDGVIGQHATRADAILPTDSAVTGHDAEGVSGDILAGASVSEFDIHDEAIGQRDTSSGPMDEAEYCLKYADDTTQCLQDVCDNHDMQVCHWPWDTDKRDDVSSDPKTMIKIVSTTHSTRSILHNIPYCLHGTEPECPTHLAQASPSTKAALPADADEDLHARDLGQPHSTVTSTITAASIQKPIETPHPSGFWDHVTSLFGSEDDDVETWVDENFDKRTAGPKPVSSFFLCPGPCTDCGSFESFVGNGAAPTPGTDFGAGHDEQHKRRLPADVLMSAGHASTMPHRQKRQASAQPTLAATSANSQGNAGPTATFTYEDDGTQTVTRYTQPSMATMIGSDTLIPTTDSDGNPGWVTRTGDWASSTTTATVPGLTGTKVITSSPVSVSVFTQTVTASPSSALSSSSVSTTTVTVSSSSAPSSSSVGGMTETVIANSSSALPTPTKVITTVTEVVFDPLRRCTRTMNPWLSTATVVNIADSEFNITKSTQKLNNGTVIVAPPSPQATLFPISRHKNFVQDLLNLALSADQLGDSDRGILNTDMDSLHKNQPHINWVVVAELAYVLRQSHQSIDRDLADKVSVLWVLTHPELSKRDDSDLVPITTPAPAVFKRGDHHKRHSSAHTVYDSTHGRPQPVTNGNNVTVWATPTNSFFDYPWAARQSHIPKPPACVKGNSEHDKTRCLYQKCMLKHYKPINITTAYPAAVLQDYGRDNTDYAYVTQSTSLTRPHWGTTIPGFTYYPLKPTVTLGGKNGQPTPAMVPDVPSVDINDAGWRHGWKHGGLMNKIGKLDDKYLKTYWDRFRSNKNFCWDQCTCCSACQREAKHRWWKNPLIWTLIGTLTLLLALALLACLCCGHLFRKYRRRRRQNQNPQKSWHDYVPAAVPYFGRRNRPQAVVIDPATGQPIATFATQTTEGHGIDPTLAAAGGVAAGAALANEKHEGGGNADTPAPATVVVTQAVPADDGRGTMGRKAEEGRSKVQFADGGAPVAPQQVVATAPTGQQVVVTAAPAPTPAPATTEQVVTSPAPAPAPASTEHVEPITAHHDGAYDGAYDGVPTGRQMADMGSMRGRKRNRNNGAQGDCLNIPF